MDNLNNRKPTAVALPEVAASMADALGRQIEQLTEDKLEHQHSLDAAWAALEQVVAAHETAKECLQASEQELLRLQEILKNVQQRTVGPVNAAGNDVSRCLLCTCLLPCRSLLYTHDWRVYHGVYMGFGLAQPVRPLQPDGAPKAAAAPSFGAPKVAAIQQQRSLVANGGLQSKTTFQKSTFGDSKAFGAKPTFGAKPAGAFNQGGAKVCRVAR